MSIILAAIFLGTAPLAALEGSDPKIERAESTVRLGKETVAAIRTAYEKGEYDPFLHEMDAAYQEADLDNLMQMRQKQIPADFQDKWEQQFLSLQKEKNRELLSALSDKDDSLFAEKVRSAAASLSTPEQEKAISKLNAFITMASNAGANEDENALIDLDLEYEYKLLHAQLPTENLSSQQRHERQIALRMEKMDKMVEASKSFQDHALKQAVALAAANFDARLARNLDGADLYAGVKGNVKPSNELEQKIYSILSSYQGKFSDLMKELDASNK